MGSSDLAASRFRTSASSLLLWAAKKPGPEFPLWATKGNCSCREKLEINVVCWVQTQDLPYHTEESSQLR